MEKRNFTNDEVISILKEIRNELVVNLGGNTGWLDISGEDCDKVFNKHIAELTMEHVADSAKGTKKETKKETDGYSIPSNWDDLSPQERNACLGIFS